MLSKKMKYGLGVSVPLKAYPGTLIFLSPISSSCVLYSKTIVQAFLYSIISQ